MSKFEPIKPSEITPDPFSLIGENWGLVTAGTEENANTMTVSWGSLGFLWNMPICNIYIRPERYTYQFTESENLFTLSFLPSEFRKALQFCGSETGRGRNKISDAGLSAIKLENGGIGITQANLIIECEKIYYNDLIPDNFLSSDINKFYESHGIHRMYTGRILSCLRATH